MHQHQPDKGNEARKGKFPMLTVVDEAGVLLIPVGDSLRMMPVLMLPSLGLLMRRLKAP